MKAGISDCTAAPRLREKEASPGSRLYTGENVHQAWPPVLPAVFCYPFLYGMRPVHGGAETKKALRTGAVRRALQPVLREQGYSSPSPPAESSFLAFLRRSQMCMSFIF